MLAKSLRHPKMGDAHRHRGTLRLAYVVLSVAILATFLLPADASSVVAVLAIICALGGAAWYFITATGSLSQAERRAWRLLGIGLLLAALGLVVHGVAWTIAGDVPTFGPVDLFWLAGYLVGIAGIAALPHTAGSKWQRLRLLLDGVIGGVAASAILWTVKLREITEGLESAPLWERLIASSYIMLDALLVVVLISVGIKRSNYRFDRRLMFIGGAITAQGIGDYIFVTAGLGRTFGEVQPVYAFPIIAAVLFLAAGADVARVPHAREYADRTSRPAWAMLLPYGLATALVVSLLLRLPRVSANPTDRTLLLAAVLLGALVFTRQALTIRESGRLLDDQRTDLVASVSHELRTPLTTMVGFLELLNADAFVDATERREMTSIANRQAAYLSRVVSDLLMLASDTDPEMDLDIEAVPVEELTWCAVDAASIDPSRVRVTADSATTAFLDEARIQQALANFLNNAARYGGGTVEVVAVVDGGDLLLEVHDDGPGVPRKHEFRIWEKFERGPHRLNAVVPGSGIGLAITSAIARAHGGAVGYQRSRRLGGACFWIRLPGRVQTDQPVRHRLLPKLTQSTESDARIA